MNWKILALFIGAAAIVAGCGEVAAPGASSTPSASATTSVSPAPTPTTQGPPVGFVVGSVSGGSDTTYAQVATVRTDAHPGYDRFVIEFRGTVSSYTVETQLGSTFTLSPSGKTVQLDGSNGVVVTVRHIDNWTTYAGPLRLTLGSRYLREARQIQNFEGVQQWGLAISGTPAIRVFVLEAPPRLVVDVTTY